MKTKLGLFLLILAIGFGLARAQTPAPPTLEKGKILLLPSERALEGDIEKVGDKYRICRGQGETTIPVSQTLRLCKDWAEAFEFMKSRANLADADEHLRLVRWCHLHNLREEALAEAKIALSMRPNDPQAKHWSEVLQRPTTTNPVKNIVQTGGLGPASKLPQLDLNADSVIAFTNRVQPILMNVCANCHVGGRGGNFHLTRAFEGGAKVASQRNLASVMAQIHFDDPAISPLLVKAVAAHDGIALTPPLPGRQAQPFRVLQSWIEQTLASNPQLKSNKTEVAKPGSPPRLIPEIIVKAPTLLSPGLPAAKDQVVSKTIERLPDGLPTRAAPPPGQLPVSLNQAQPLTTPVTDDLFDPGEFNRLNHPRK